VSSNRSYDDRHHSAVEVLSSMQLNAIDGERATRAWYRRHGALGSLSMDVVMGDVWSRPGLARRDRSLMVIGLLAAMHSVDELSAHTVLGLNNGLSRVEVDEVLLHVAATTGFPAAMAAARVVDEAFCRLDGVERQPMRQPAASKGDIERRDDAARILAAFAAGAPARTGNAFGEVGELAQLYEMGEIWSRTVLHQRDRSLVVIALLTWLGVEDDLRWHFTVGLGHGLSPEELTEAMVHLTIYVGVPRAIRGYEILRDLLATA
jgi:4-carboxymuconolactone decarboxylase